MKKQLCTKLALHLRPPSTPPHDMSSTCDQPTWCAKVPAQHIALRHSWSDIVLKSSAGDRKRCHEAYLHQRDNKHYNLCRIVKLKVMLPAGAPCNMIAHIPLCLHCKGRACPMRQRICFNPADVCASQSSSTWLAMRQLALPQPGPTRSLHSIKRWHACS